MDIHLYFIQELIAAGLISLTYVKTLDNVAHFLTKALGRTMIRRSLLQIGISGDKRNARL